MGENFDLIKQIGSFFIIALIVFTFTTVSRVVIMRVVVYFFHAYLVNRRILRSIYTSVIHPNKNDRSTSR